MKRELHEGARLFNAGCYWEAHEAWEEQWRRASGDERKFVQALILLAAAMHKRWHHGSTTGRNFIKAERYLAQLPSQYDGVHLQELAGQVAAALQDEHVRPRLPLEG